MTSAARCSRRTHTISRLLPMRIHSSLRSKLFLDPSLPPTMNGQVQTESRWLPEESIRSNGFHATPSCQCYVGPHPLLPCLERREPEQFSRQLGRTLHSQIALQELSQEDCLPIPLTNSRVLIAEPLQLGDLN